MTPEERNREAKYCLDTGDYSRAEVFASEAIAAAQVSGDKEQEANGLNHLGNVERLRGNYSAAEKHFRHALAINEEMSNKDGITKNVGNIGLVYYGLSDFPKALEYMEKALAFNEELGNKQGSAGVLHNIGLVHEYLSDYPKAMEYYRKALAINEEKDNQYWMAHNLAGIGNVYCIFSEYATALEYFLKALKLHESLGVKDGIANDLVNIGTVYRNLADNSAALMHFQKALAIYEEVGSKHGTASTLSSIGIFYESIGDYPKALEFYQKALVLEEELGSKFGIAGILHNIGDVYENLVDNVNALEYYQKALAINEHIENRAWMANNLGGIGNVHMNRKNYTTALEYYQNALVLQEELGLNDGIAGCLCNIGTVYGTLSQYADALEYFHRSLALYEELGIKSGIASNLCNIGKVYVDTNYEEYNMVTAEEFLRKAMDMCAEINAKQLLYEVHKSLAALYEYEHQWEKALEQYQKYIAVRDEVQSDEAKKQAGIMEQRRQEEERAKQIAIAQATADAKHQTTMSILHKTLPPVIADRLIVGEKDIADRYESVSILFADIVGFTPLSARLTPREVVHILNNLFSRFDTLTEKYGVERIKTIGDAYMIVSGAPHVVADHAERIAMTAIGMLEEVRTFNSETNNSIRLRIGVSTGEAVAAVVGNVKFSYDLWGDAVNTASRMESHGEPGKIHCSEEFMQALVGTGRQGQTPESPFFTERGEIDIKGKGKMKTYFLEKK